MTPRALFTSPVQPIGGASADVYSWNKRPGAFRLYLSFLNHPGLSFLKANLPIEILEYPSRESFERALASLPDILGISFHVNETEIALEMAAHARSKGVSQIWAGNYGSYSPTIAKYFDRVFTGWSERSAAEALGVPIAHDAELVHPEIYSVLGVRRMPNALLHGVLFTSRGCPWTCNFCQTPEFYGKAKSMPLPELARILGVYRDRGIRTINILDENFGTFKSHARQVVRLLHEYGMRWVALTRVDTLSDNFDDWQAHGLVGAHLGIESLNQNSLAGGSKRIQNSQTQDILRRLSAHHMFVQCFYIIGFEEDTTASIKQDISNLAEMDVDLVQVQILTPYPRTGQRESIEQAFGITDYNLSKYNSRNLVWNHPSITAQEIKELQSWADTRITGSGRALRSLFKLGLYGGRPRLSTEGFRMVGQTMNPALKGLQHQLRDRLAAARRWAEYGWPAYEEYPASTALTAHSVNAAMPLAV